jgi:RNA 2',3'-cyclic 3'-phosphodiesterase
MMSEENRTNSVSGETSRLFVALPLSAAVRELVADAQRGLRRHDWPVKWVDPELAHMTLKFLGETDNDLVPEIERVLDSVARGHRPVDLRTARVGAFPSLKRAQVFWIGLAGDAGKLTGLAGEIDSVTASLGFETERRPFRPHITLGRVRKGRVLPRDAGQIVNNFDTPVRAARFDRFQLIQSVLGQSGPSYTVLNEWQLGALESSRVADPVELVEHG